MCLIRRTPHAALAPTAVIPVPREGLLEGPHLAQAGSLTFRKWTFLARINMLPSQELPPIEKLAPCSAVSFTTQLACALLRQIFLACRRETDRTF